MELPSKLLEQIAFNTRPKIEEHMLIIMDKFTHEEHLSQPLQTNSKKFKIAVTFLTAYNGIFNVTNSNNKFHFTKSITDDNHYVMITIPPGSYELESLNDEIKRIIINDEYFTEDNYPFVIKPNFSTLGSIIGILNEKSAISFKASDSIGSLLGFNKRTIYDEYNLSDNPVDILSFDMFIETNIAQGMIFKGNRSGIIFNFTMDVNPGYKYIHKFHGGIQWYMMESKDIISSICFKLKNENGNLVSLNGQNVNFRLSIREI